MKRAILLIVILASVASRLSAARLCPSTGRVVDEQGNAVEYATVVLLKGAEQVAGRTTDARGRFELKPHRATTRCKFSSSGSTP